MRHLVIPTFFAACLVMTKTSILENKIFIFQKPEDESNKTHLVVTWKLEEDGERVVGCEVFSNPQIIEEVMKESNDKLIRSPTDQDMQDILDECTEISRRRRRRDSAPFGETTVSWRRRRAPPPPPPPRNGRRVNSGNNQNRNNEKVQRTTPATTTEVPYGEEENGNSTGILSSLPFIFPGTKWCGNGAIAKSYDDLGYHADTDVCCRAHDLCNDTMVSGETKNNLTNDSSFTKLHCQCDNEFWECLDKTNTVTSNTLGKMYFNILRRDCYDEIYPETNECKTYRSFMKITCYEYERATKKEYQWVPAKRYKKLPIPGPLTIEI